MSKRPEYLAPPELVRINFKLVMLWILKVFIFIVVLQWIRSSKIYSKVRFLIIILFFNNYILYSILNKHKFTLYSSRIIDIQEQMCRRALELLLLPHDKSILLLDIGCGSGLSGNVIEKYGHIWIGIDISHAMLGKYI